MDRYLKQLGGGWAKADDGSYRHTTINGEGLKLSRVEDGWVAIVLLDDKPLFGHHYPSFKQLLNSLTSTQP